MNVSGIWAAGRKFLSSRPPFILLFFITVVQTGCLTTAPPVQITRESSAAARPEWIDKPPQQDGIVFFTGISTSTQTFEEGMNGALNDAMSKIGNYLGSRVESSIDLRLNEVEQELRQQIKSKSRATVRGAALVDSYHEKMIRTEGAFKMERYDVYVLVSFSKEEAEREINRQREEKQSKAKTAYNHYVNGLNSEKRDKYYDARRFYKEALDVINEIDDVVEIKSPDIKNSKELSLALQNRLQKAASMLSRISITIKAKGANGSEQTFTSNLSSALSKYGFTVTKESPNIKIIGDVSLSEGGYAMNNHVSYAEGSISAQRVSDRQIIATYPFKVKGFHKIKQQSAVNALMEAGLEAGEGISKMIKEKENMGNQQ